MENKQIKDLMTAMSKTGTTRLCIKQKGFELELEQAKEQVVQKFMHSDSISHYPAHPAHHIPASLHPPKEDSPKEEEDEEAEYITSPMVGTFYSSPSPEDPSFVQPGDRVEPGTVLCIIEAMKVMNEIKAEKAGIIADILVESGHPVEFGAKLFKVK
ncbi:MAG: acetyl-CoA carboxylase biotin carboxyl carrier protein [Waddliaceae bacterium]